MFRNTVFASLIALGAAATAGTAAQAADNGPRLVNRNGSQEVVYDGHRGNIVGGAYATITGGGENTAYSAAPGVRTEEPALVGRLSGGGDNEVITYGSQARLGAQG
ncbi:MAG: hypothetical protein ICV73_00040 [Acetobacteraceae bacterium]|nr:hypothetical protein [Acetobacteraceae bacterium]